MTNVMKTHWEVSHDENHRQGCFRVRWTATVRSDSPQAAVARVWCEFFRPSTQDLFCVYRTQTGEHSTHRAGTLLPELRRDTPANQIYVITWDAHAFADHAEGALRAVLGAYFKATDLGKRLGLSGPIPAEARGRLQ